MKKLLILFAASLLTTSCSPWFWYGVLAGLESAMSTQQTPSYYGSGYSSYPATSTSSSGSSYSTTSSSSSTSTSSSSYTRTPRKCSLCSGTGRVVENDGVTFGLSDTKYCSECGKQVPLSHYHTTCPSCKGKGEW